MAFAMHGVPATVVVPDAEPIETRAIWISPSAITAPDGAELQRTGPKRYLALPAIDLDDIAGVPEVPRGTVISCAESHGGEVADWEVDSLIEVRHDQHRVLVIPTVES